MNVLAIIGRLLYTPTEYCRACREPIWTIFSRQVVCGTCRFVPGITEGHPRFIRQNEPCMDRFAGWWCTLPKGHAGDHAAHEQNGRVMQARWPQDSDAQAKEVGGTEWP